jgi:hypothetical protein
MIDINDYASPPWETSLFKGIPMAEIETVRELMKQRGLNYRFRFRGPRPSRKYQSYIPKTMATTFAVYDNDYRPY